MGSATIPDADFLRLFNDLGASALAKRLKIDVRAVYSRRERLEIKYGRQLTSPNTRCATRFQVYHPGFINAEVKNGVVLIASDAHYWPGDPTVCHRAFVKFCKEYKPAVVILNGDVVDLASISRHPPIGWEKHPTVQEEIETAQDRLHEIESAAYKARKIWTLGNHDQRYETRLATLAPEFARVHGVHLRDHFPLWEPCWVCVINNDVEVKHRFKGGQNNRHNSTLWAGRNIVVGHDHCPRVNGFTDRNGTRYEVNSGCLADANHRAFLDYTEGSSKNWRSAFCMLTFRDGKLLMPELIAEWDSEHVEFRAEIIKV